MSTVDERQRARDRAADAIATREQVKIGPKDWTPATVHDPLLPQRERRRRARARSRANAAR